MALDTRTARPRRRWNSPVALGIVVGVISGVVSALLVSWISRSSVPQAQPDAGVRHAGKELSAEEADALHRERHEEAIRKHDDEKLDSPWAGAANADFTSDLTKLGLVAKFDVLKVDCRSKSCIATLRWATYTDARANYRRILQNQYEMNCAVEVLIPHPSVPSSSYDATIVFGPCSGRE